MEKITIAVITESGELHVFNKSIDDLKALTAFEDWFTTDEMVDEYVHNTFWYSCMYQVIKIIAIVL